MAKPSFIWTFWLAISQAWKVWPQLSFHENEENNVLRKIRFDPRGSTWFSASIEILVSWTFRLAHIPAYNTYMYPLHRPLHHSPDIRFVWKEREKEKMSERERDENAEPRLAPGYHGSSGSSFCPALSDTDRSTGSADYVPAFYDRTPSRLVSTIIFAFLPALSLQQRQALVRQFEKQQVTLRHPSNWPTFFSLFLLSLYSWHRS